MGRRVDTEILMGRNLRIGANPGLDFWSVVLFFRTFYIVLLFL